MLESKDYQSTDTVFPFIFCICVHGYWMYRKTGVEEREKFVRRTGFQNMWEKVEWSKKFFWTDGVVEDVFE